MNRAFLSECSACLPPVLAILFAVMLLGGGIALAAPRPNIVIILADDLGWADLGCYGNTYHETPYIDRLAREGMRFTQFYAGPVCSPTRANLQTGQDQARFGITQHIPGHRRPFAKLIDPEVPLQLPLKVETFAERLRGAGYATGYFGKWHLGGVGFGPSDQGWDDVIEHAAHTVPPEISGHAKTWRAAEFLGAKGIKFMEKNREKPFLLFVSPFAVHFPLLAREELMDKYRAKPPMPGYGGRPDYAALLDELDASVGQLVAAIDRLGLAEKTFVFFLSDNGALEFENSGRAITSNRPLRGEKGTLYEGGIRVPAIVRCPGRVPAGALCETPTSTIDIYPTLLDIATAALPAGQPIDGASILSLLENPEAALPRDTLYWHLPHYHHSTPASAVRRGDWKLLEFYETDAWELFDLSRDPGETMNLAQREPARARELGSALAAWRHKVGARMPRPNPAYDPVRAGELLRRQPPIAP